MRIESAGMRGNMMVYPLTLNCEPAFSFNWLKIEEGCMLEHLQTQKHKIENVKTI